MVASFYSELLFVHGRLLAVRRDVAMDVDHYFHVP